jgi:Skp family chaperone for outer membrane proteins
MAAEEQETQKIISLYFTKVSKLAEKKNLSIVFFKDVTMYYLPSENLQNITDQIIKMSVSRTK